MDMDLRREERRPGVADPEAELTQLVRLSRIDALDLRDEGLLQRLGLLGGELSPAWLEGSIRAAFRSDAALGGVGETDLKGPVLAACVAVARRTLQSWRREPKLHVELSAHLAEFELLANAPLLPSRQARVSSRPGELHAFLERIQPEGRQRAGVLALRELFGAFSRSGRGHLQRALDYTEPFISKRRIREAFSEEFVRYALGRASR